MIHPRTAAHARLVKILLITVFVAFCCIQQTYAQVTYTIKGTVADSKGQTLPGATVFISGSKIITVTDGEGKFTLWGVPPGTYVLVATFVGYQPSSQSVTVTNKPAVANFRLDETTNTLAQVVVTADPNWEIYYNIFLNKFLGTTPNAAKCTLMNKEALHFHFDKQTQILTATADDFIDVENKALGYKIKYVLEAFTYDKKTGMVTYQGYPLFKELKALTDKQAKDWQHNRSIAFKGSITHFILSLYQGNAASEGFRLYGTDYDEADPLDENGKLKKIALDNTPVPADSLITLIDINTKSLAFKRAMFVVYVNEREGFEIKNSGYMLERPFGKTIPSGQYSLVCLMDDQVMVDANGNYSRPDGLVFRGHMAWEQVADLIPLDYRQPDKANSE